MNKIKQYLTIFVASLAIATLANCAASAPTYLETTNTREETVVARPSAIVMPTPTPTSSHTPTAIKSQSDRSSPEPDTITVNIYQIDSQCENFIPIPVFIPAEESLEATVKQVLEWQDSRDFNWGYRVKVDRHSGVATIDLRVSTNSLRQITSLSSCEQMALFGGLRKTLTGNSIWNIKEVRFTEDDIEIWL